MVSWGMRRPKTSTSGLPRISAQIDSISSAKVVTLMPPLVEPEPPPMNISRSVSNSASPLICPTSRVANPPDRGITAVNPAASTLPPTPWPPRVAGFDHSISRYPIHAQTSSAAVVTRVSLACMLQWRGLRHWRSPRHWSMHAKLTLVTTAALLVCAWIGYLLIEWSNPATLGGQGVGGKVLAAGFTAVMPRSGGFATLDVGQMSGEALLLTDLLMFIGGGSGSTSGGIKVTTFALLMLSIWAEIRGNPDVEVFGRRIPHETIRQAIGVVVMSAAVVIVATFLLLNLTSFTLDQVLRSEERRVGKG